MNKITHLFLLILILISATSCSTTNRNLSYIDKIISKNDAEILADDIIEYLYYSLPPATSTLRIYPPRKDILTPILLAKLRTHGYAVVVAVEDMAETKQEIVLKYLISPLDEGVILRLQYLKKEAARIYERDNNGKLFPQTSFSVREDNNKQDE